MYAIIYPASGGIAQLGERLVRIQEVRGSNPLISTRSAAVKTAARLKQNRINSHGGIAQLGECLTGSQEVTGSSPVISTRKHGQFFFGLSVFLYLQCIYIRDEIVDAVGILNLGGCSLENQKFAQAVFRAVVCPVVCISESCPWIRAVEIRPENS